MQDSRHLELQHTPTSMDAGDNNTASSPVMATPTETANPLPLRDETAAILEETFGGGDTISVDPEGHHGLLQLADAHAGVPAKRLDGSHSCRD